MPRVSEQDGMFVKFTNWYTRRTYGRDTAIARPGARASHAPCRAGGRAERGAARTPVVTV